MTVLPEVGHKVMLAPAFYTEFPQFAERIPAGTIGEVRAWKEAPGQSQVRRMLFIIFSKDALGRPETMGNEAIVVEAALVTRVQS